MAVLSRSFDRFHLPRIVFYGAGQLFFYIRSRAFIVITVMKDIIKQEETVYRDGDNEDDDNEDDDERD